jgi:hypothetical protein
MKKILMTAALVLVVGTATVVRGTNDTPAIVRGEVGQRLISDQHYTVSNAATKDNPTQFVFLNKTDQKVKVIVQVNGQDKVTEVSARGVQTIKQGPISRAEFA